MSTPLQVGRSSTPRDPHERTRCRFCRQHAHYVWLNSNAGMLEGIDDNLLVELTAELAVRRTCRRCATRVGS
jgi:hypothetical protein